MQVSKIFRSRKIIEQTGKKQVQNLCKQLNQTKKAQIYNQFWTVSERLVSSETAL
jgi:hypothetical protein